MDANTGAFSWTPGYHAAAGSPYTVTFTATANGQTTTEAITITVTNADRAPTMTAIGNKSVAEAATLSFSVACNR